MKKLIYYMNPDNIPKCQVVFRRGPNKGKICGDVDQRCSHEPTVCQFCNEEFLYKKNYLRHAEKCRPAKIPVKITLKESGTQQQILEEIIELKEEIKSLKSQIDSAGAGTIVSTNNGTINTTNNNIVNNGTINTNIYIGNDLYADLKKLYGSVEAAIDFINNMICNNNPTALVKALHRTPYGADETPIATKISGNQVHVRYMCDSGLVDDIGGKKTAEFIANKNKDAIVRASNDIISNIISSGKEANDTEYEMFYRAQDYASEQKNPSNKKQIITELKEFQHNPNHPYYSHKLPE